MLMAYLTMIINGVDKLNELTDKVRVYQNKSFKWGRMKEKEMIEDGMQS
jgi:hypothetical protein